MGNDFNEKNRVQLPALVHLLRLGYKYVGKIHEENAGETYDSETNILIDKFRENFVRLNPDKANDWQIVLSDIKKELNDDDLGKSFYKRLTSNASVKLIDFDNPDNNDFSVTGEFTCRNGEDNFRPDITLFVNGLPLVFIEVKKPNNKDGMVAEAERMANERFPNQKFRRFINITQLMIFSNNMEYTKAGGITPIEGVFYCTRARKRAFFNCFREDNFTNEPVAPYNKNYPYIEIDKKVEKKILYDFNSSGIINKPEYNTSKDINSPTNRVLTSMCSPERLLYILKYGIAYVKSEREVDGVIETTDQKHIMRYQQMFASMAIIKALDNNKKSGIVWHTQGSGKTALSYFLTKILTDYYAKKNTVTKFYFVVDRLDLLEQASQEFKSRGLEVQTVNSKKDLMEQFRTTQSQEGASGKAEISVINIQKVDDDPERIAVKDFATNLQRVFIIDEAHRDYKPGGTFLTNLFNADKNSIRIALTGTPLLKSDEKDTNSREVFGDYYHVYYYDKSIQDGYTLKILREDIETSYKVKLQQVQEELEKKVQKKELKKENIIEHENYVKELLRYIIKDLSDFRNKQNDPTLGGMIICESSEQARKLYKYFYEIQDELLKAGKVSNIMNAGLILYDSDDKETKKKIINDFKKNFTVDILIVFNMLLTGFDAPRLKRLYFGRKLKKHNLLQAITRVNRPYTSEYGTQEYGTVIDFADIKQNFEEINNKYISELKAFSNEEETGIPELPDIYNSILESREEIVRQMKDAKQALSSFDTSNAEEFEREINDIEDKNDLLKLRTALVEAKNMSNLVKTFGDDELKQAFEKIAIKKLPQLLSSVQARINLINLENAFKTSDATKMMINEAMANIQFNFKLIGTEELSLIDNGEELQKTLDKTIRAFTSCIDTEDPEYITLQEAFQLRFKQHNFKPENVEQYNEEKAAMNEIYKQLSEMTRKNNVLMKKYNDDEKFVRVHKRILEENKKRNEENKSPIISKYDDDIVEFMTKVKVNIDNDIYNKMNIVNNQTYFERAVSGVIGELLYEYKADSLDDDYDFLENRVSKQYLKQYAY